jgi:hypothetical protein
MLRVVFPASIWREVTDLLAASGAEEVGAFFLFKISSGVQDRRVLVSRLIPPPTSAWETKDRDRLRPSGQWLSSALGQAVRDAEGIGFFHSHPGIDHPPGLSPIDLETSLAWAKTIVPLVEVPFLSLVWSPGGVAGRWFEVDGDTAGEHDVDRVVAVGEGRVRILHPPTVPADRELDDRQIRAINPIGNLRLRELDVVVVGAGGTGSPVAEALARMGARKITVIDPDRLDTPSNLRRLVGATLEDLRQRRPKAEIVAGHIRGLGLGVVAVAVVADVRSDVGARHLKDADLVISTTDTHSSRALINQVAYQYSVPTIDVGIRVGRDVAGSISGMPVELRLLLPDTGCLWCTDSLSSDRIREENLPLEDRARLAAEGYVQGDAGPAPSLAPLNQMASSVALITALRVLLDGGEESPRWIVDAWSQYSMPMPATIRPDCICAAWRGKGDTTPLPVLPTT